MRAWERSSWTEKIDGKRERGGLRRQWERDIWDVFDMSLTEVGRLALVRDCFSCAVKDVTSNGISSYKQLE